ncbi:MAG: four helix bundle protein [Bacteroidetes bacterium]|nr:four helix bundle protein [Bacteroidota bacterium]
MRNYTKNLTFEFAEKKSKVKTNKLNSQFKMNTASIPSNIAEDCVSDIRTKYLRFLKIFSTHFVKLHYQFGLSIYMAYIKKTEIDNCSLKLFEAEM